MALHSTVRTSRTCVCPQGLKPLVMCLVTHTHTQTFASLLGCSAALLPLWCSRFAPDPDRSSARTGPGGVSLHAEPSASRSDLLSCTLSNSGALCRLPAGRSQQGQQCTVERPSQQQTHKNADKQGLRSTITFHPHHWDLVTHVGPPLRKRLQSCQACGMFGMPSSDSCCSTVLALH